MEALLPKPGGRCRVCGAGRCTALSGSHCKPYFMESMLLYQYPIWCCAHYNRLARHEDPQDVSAITRWSQS
jgi:hypothetical protein